MDRRTDDPDSSGGASPTAVTSRQDGDDRTADNGQDTRPAGIIGASPVRPRTSDDLDSARLAWDAPAGGQAAGENGTQDPGSAVTDAAGDDAPARPAEAASASAFDSSAFNTPAWDSSGFSFSSPVSAPDSPVSAPDWSTSPVSWSLGDPDEPSPGGSFAAGTPAPADQNTGPDTARPPGQPSFSASYADVPATVSPPSAPPAAPDPPAVSAAAFTWDTPDPPPTSPSSPARTFLRSAGTAKPPAPARPPVTVSSPPRPAPIQSPPPVRKAPPKAASRRSVRQAHLTIARVEPWSVMKFSFVVSLVAFVILFIVVSVLWGSLSALGVFESLQRVVSNVTSSQSSSGVNAAKWFSASRVLGWTALLGSLNIVLITAISTIGAVVYNLTSRLVGGVEVTLRETE